jgi:single-stranded DNA-binding protein
MLEAAIIGTVWQPIELKLSKNSKPYAQFSLAVDDGEDPAGFKVVEWVKVAVFGETAERLARTSRRGDRLLCLGALKLARWMDADNFQRFQMQMAASRAELVGLSALREKAETAIRKYAAAPQPSAKVVNLRGKRA